jgi:adenylate kinase
LTACLRIPHISTGDMLRDRIRQQDGDLGTAVAATMQSGSLVSDEVVKEMVEERLSEPDAADGFVLDGYPRTMAQAKHLCAWLDERHIRELVIYLAVDYNVVIARMTGRRQCPRCGTLYNLVSKPPKVDSLCDLDGEPLVIREDDDEAVIRERLDAYERLTRPVLDYLRTAGRRVVEVDASSDPPPVLLERICQAMDCNDCPKDRC